MSVFLTAGNVTATRTVRLAGMRPTVGTAPMAPTAPRNQGLSAATETSSVATSTVTE